MPTSLRSAGSEAGRRIRSPVHSSRQLAHGHSRAQEQVREAIHLPIGPGDLENLFGLQGPDIAGRIDHSWYSVSGTPAEQCLMDIESNRDEPGVERPAGESRRFYVRAASVNAVRRALYRAPGGARVVGRFDRGTIECQHTMDGHSYRRHWPVIISRLEKAGLVVVERQEVSTGNKSSQQDLPRNSSLPEFEDIDH